MENDDQPVGRVLTRREMLSLLAGMGGAVLLAACDPAVSSTAQSTATGAKSSQATGTPLNQEAQTAVAASPVGASPTADTAAVPDCVVRPELTEGPYFVDEKLNRSDIRPDPSNNTVSEGVPLALAFVVSQVGTGSCVPLKDAQVDVWHCDALGVYSDVQGSTGTKFLRGYQLTDANGNARFTTVYPGWYQGRAVHIHFKICTTSTAQESYEFTSELFLDELITDVVHAQQPYAGKGYRTLKNDGDNIYQNGGSQLLISPVKSGDGYTATFNIGLDLSDTQTGQADGGS